MIIPNAHIIYTADRDTDKRQVDSKCDDDDDDIQFHKYTMRIMN